MYKKGTFPEIVHVHVCYKAGLFALWLKWRFGIPYGITEHWTFFTKERKDNYLKSNFLKKWLIKIIYNNSSFVLPVSFNLEGQLLNFFPKISSFVIPNVVDPISFFYSTNSQKSDSFHFIHVSSLGLLKNPMIILKVFIRLLIKYRNVGLDIVGPINDDFLSEFEKLDHGRDKINLVGQIEHHEVADKLRIANAFVLFSSSENLPCVIAESLCCGVPVISSSVGGIPEMVNDSNGILVTPGDEEALYSAMENMILNYSKYDRKKISEEAQSKYNPEVVGKQIADVYEKVLSKKTGK
jgi:glycosyltransferase involved in cell wall biosynthesis